MLFKRKILSRLMLVNFVVGVQKRHKNLRAFLRSIFSHSPHETSAYVWSEGFFLFVIFIAKIRNSVVDKREIFIKGKALENVIKIIYSLFALFSQHSTSVFCYRRRSHFFILHMAVDYRCVSHSILSHSVKMLCENANIKLLSQESRTFFSV